MEEGGNYSLPTQQLFTRNPATIYTVPIFHNYFRPPSLIFKPDPGKYDCLNIYHNLFYNVGLYKNQFIRSRKHGANKFWTNNNMIESVRRYWRWVISPAHKAVTALVSSKVQIEWSQERADSDELRDKIITLWLFAALHLVWTFVLIQNPWESDQGSDYKCVTSTTSSQWRIHSTYSLFHSYLHYNGL